MFTRLKCIFKGHPINTKLDYIHDEWVNELYVYHYVQQCNCGKNTTTRTVRYNEKQTADFKKRLESCHP